jgi:elongation factor G
MSRHATENIRNVAVAGHSHTGKTSLVSALLFDSGVVNRLCKVDDGNTTTDFDDDEQERKITINTAVAHFEHRGVKVNLIDTPGLRDLHHRRRAGAAGRRRHADADLGGRRHRGPDREAVEGRGLLRAAGALRRQPDGPRPRLLLAHPRRAAEEVRPRGHAAAAADRRGVELRRAWSTWSAARPTPGSPTTSGKPTEVDVPADMADEVAAAREALMEMVAEQDETLMERLPRGRRARPETFVAGLKKAVASAPCSRSSRSPAARTSACSRSWTP